MTDQDIKTDQDMNQAIALLQERRSRRRLAGQFRGVVLFALGMVVALAWKHAWSSMGLWLVQAWLFSVYARSLTRLNRDPEAASPQSFVFKFRAWWGDWLCRHGRHRWRKGDWKRRCLRCELRQHLETVGFTGPFMWQTLHDQSSWAEANLFGEDIGP